MMTRLTALLIQGGSEVFASSFGPIDGKYGLYVGTLDEAPSGHKRPRPLLTSEPIYETPELAKSAADELILEVRKICL